jgi:hypothetical protein
MSALKGHNVIYSERWKKCAMIGIRPVEYYSTIIIHRRKRCFVGKMFFGAEETRRRGEGVVLADCAGAAAFIFSGKKSAAYY